jgi:asparagine synthetase B (glutamine-hydrolysing)
MTNETRPIHEIADDIHAAWPNVYFGAKPYLEAMQDLNSIEENYGNDSARSIVLYFLSNANSFRGEEARALKAELKALVSKKGGAR